MVSDVTDSYVALQSLIRRTLFLLFKRTEKGSTMTWKVSLVILIFLAVILFTSKMVKADMVLMH